MMPAASPQRQQDLTIRVLASALCVNSVIADDMSPDEDGDHGR